MLIFKTICSNPVLIFNTVCNKVSYDLNCGVHEVFVMHHILWLCLEDVLQEMENKKIK
jgi:hypothetical protein